MITKDITIRHNNRNISGRLYLPQKDKFPMVILSHGFNGHGDDFSEYAETLAENEIGACTFDFCGGSLRSKSDWTTTEMTVFTEKEDLSAVIDTVKNQYGIDNIFLFGASMGGLVSALCSEEYSDEIKGLILLYPAFCVADNWNEYFPDVDDIPEIHRVWEVPLCKCFFETLHGFDVFEQIGNYSKNVLIMHGDKDNIVPLEYSDRANKIYKNSKLQVFSGEGHGFSANGDRRVAEMLVDFIKAV